MNQDEKTRAVPNYYGTFQGVANYYPPFPQQQPPPHSFVGIPHSVPPPRGYINPFVHGYQAVSDFPIEGVPLREPRLPVCGLGIGWLLFFLGFVFGGIPWYCATFILLCVQVDYREKAGYIACALAGFHNSVTATATDVDNVVHFYYLSQPNAGLLGLGTTFITMIVVTFGLTNGHHHHVW